LSARVNIHIVYSR